MIDENGDYRVDDYGGKLHLSDNGGVISSALDLVADATLPDIDLDATYVRNLAWGAENTLYGTLYDETNDVDYIVTVNLSNGDISLVSDLGSTAYDGLAGIPKHVLAQE